MSIPHVYKAEGIILKRRTTGEADRIVTVFTREYGKLRVIAKGVRKTASRRAPHLEVFTRVDLLLHVGKSLDSVTEVNPVSAYEGLRGDLTSVSIAYYFCELIDCLLPEKQEHPDVYALLSEALAYLAQPRTAHLYRYSKEFTLRLLWMLGFLPHQKTLSGKELSGFIETITERRLKSTQFARLLVEPNA